MRYELVNVWNNKVSRQKSIEFWRQYFSDQAFDFNKRSEQVVYHVKNDNGIVGISTAEEVQLERFENNTLFNFRLMIHPDYRMPGLADKLAVVTCDFLESLFLTKKSVAIGVITLIEDTYIQHNKKRAVYRATNLIYAGQTNNGAQIRLKYFKGARI